MIEYLVGVPKSGKSYYIVNRIETVSQKIVTENVKKRDYDILKDVITDYEEKPDFYKITYKKYVSIHHNVAGYMKHNFLKTDEFMKGVVELYQLNKKEKDNPDKDIVLIEKAKQLNWFCSFIVVDECHTIMNVQHSALLWFMSYHAHIYLDMLFATQNISLINYKYKSFGEVFIKALPSSLRMIKNRFVYIHYPNARMLTNEESEKEVLYAKSEIFDLYQAGKGGSSSNQLQKWAAAIIIIAGIVVYYAYNVVNDPFSTKSKGGKKNAEKNASNIAYTQAQVKRLKSVSIEQIKNLKQRQKIENRSMQFDSVICRFDNCYFESNGISIKKKL